MVLMQNVVMDGSVETLPVDAKQAVDSWFPGYYWSPLICTKCDTPLHLGWKFTPVSADAQVSFFALIVDYAGDRKQQQNSVFVDVAEELRIGVQAPSWMVALLATHLSISNPTKF
jgi:hypothetical protein